MPRRRSPRGRPAIDVIVAGNIYCDLVFAGLPSAPALGVEQRTERFAMTAGGGAFITAAGLARLRVRAGARAYIGRDALGDFQLAALRRARIDLSQVVRHPTLGAGISVAFSTGDDRGFLTYPGCADDGGRRLRARDLPALRRAHHVHFAGMPPPFGERLRLLDGLAAARVTTSLDIGWHPARYGDPAFREVIRRVTIFLPSWRDAQWLTGRATPEDAVMALADLVAVPVIKLGAAGAIGLEDGHPVRVAPPAVAPVDTTGAGDAFNAGFLWAYLRGEPLRRCLLAGNVCGALSTRAPGGAAAFPTLRELRAHLRRGGP
jgi:sugar/nucleoside kinase (ribokinase family)